LLYSVEPRYGWLHLDHKSLDLVLESADLAHEVRGLVGGDGGSNDGAGNTASATEGHLGGNVAVLKKNPSVLCPLLLNDGKKKEESKKTYM
jgi:hypothetical protein